MRKCTPFAPNADDGLDGRELGCTEHAGCAGLPRSIPAIWTVEQSQTSTLQLRPQRSDCVRHAAAASRLQLNANDVRQPLATCTSNTSSRLGSSAPPSQRLIICSRTHVRRVH